jgi:mono/diheme cytochrome c family protein
MKRLTYLAVAFAIASAPAFAADKATERLWKSKCKSCHGADGKADTEKGKKMKMHDMSTAAWQKGMTDADLKKWTEDGIAEEKDGVKKEMDGYKDFTPEQMAGLIKMMREFGPAK